MVDFTRLEELFRKGSSLRPEERASFLEDDCASEPPELLHELREMLTIHDEDGESDALEKFDCYELLRPVGEGSYGTVYQARQTEPIRREVAVKVLKLGRDSASPASRFRPGPRVVPIG